MEETTFNQFLMTFNPSECIINYSSVNTELSAIKSGAPTLGSIKRTYGVRKTQAYIKLWLIQFNEFLNLNKPLTEQHIDEISLCIITDYPALNISDIHLVFSRAKKGRYGEFYESISMPKIISWFDKYMDSRCEAAANDSLRVHQKIKGNEYMVSRSRIESDRQKEKEFHTIKNSEYAKEIEKRRLEHEKKLKNQNKGVVLQEKFDVQSNEGLKEKPGEGKLQKG